MQTTSKPWWKSRTIISLGVLLFVTGLLIFDVTTKEKFLEAVQVAAAVVAAYFRIIATDQLKVKQ